MEITVSPVYVTLPLAHHLHAINHAHQYSVHRTTDSGLRRRNIYVMLTYTFNTTTPEPEAGRKTEIGSPKRRRHGLLVRPLLFVPAAGGPVAFPSVRRCAQSSGSTLRIAHWMRSVHIHFAACLLNVKMKAQNTRLEVSAEWRPQSTNQPYSITCLLQYASPSKKDL